MRFVRGSARWLKKAGRRLQTAVADQAMRLQEAEIHENAWMSLVVFLFSAVLFTTVLLELHHTRISPLLMIFAASTKYYPILLSKFHLLLQCLEGPRRGLPFCSTLLVHRPALAVSFGFFHGVLSILFFALYLAPSRIFMFGVAMAGTLLLCSLFLACAVVTAAHAVRMVRARKQTPLYTRRYCYVERAIWCSVAFSTCSVIQCVVNFCSCFTPGYFESNFLVLQTSFLLCEILTMVLTAFAVPHCGGGGGRGEAWHFGGVGGLGGSSRAVWKEGGMQVLREALRDRVLAPAA
uniref:Uncharacterized protein n=1 Tax=Chromera velia CCMP2878 TaxID=1169474 RepID=A0A0G4HWQ8_9ALVE|eukprot:Cvel_32727.t1-p1 / transcript=Cvel_32727.t1 / gene=Cvel_32727 / organism=Chromera_velia_CCMP2878 / gene_product=hypothetical protein / transcript_product=hypothetical protein / location=Cvel_scaffold5159:2658-4177(-) / protein_length=292 / sequence_SO=supercontig / SO=protein_coding / is_pseudo=false